VSLLTALTSSYVEDHGHDYVVVEENGSHFVAECWCGDTIEYTYGGAR
jgi:hypothetical protein